MRFLLTGLLLLVSLAAHAQRPAHINIGMLQSGGLTDVIRSDSLEFEMLKAQEDTGTSKTGLKTTLQKAQRELQRQKMLAARQVEELQKQTQLTTRQKEEMLLDQQKLKLAEQEKQLQHMAYLKTQADLEAQQNKVAENQKLLEMAQQQKELQKAELSLKNEQLELKTKTIQNRDLQRNIFIGFGVVLIGFSLVLYRNVRKQKESNRLLQQEKQKSEVLLGEVQVKSKAITDNINYARRIQGAILPDLKLIYKTLSQSFVVFLPKDIVSGDFYAYAEKGNTVLLIAGDCTGHGVSGAFMSMIASALLNQIINEKGVEQPAMILDQLNIAVIEALKQGENESSDGMDIAICAFDLSNMVVQYAGANRPLWLVRHGAIEMFKPDKFPIGSMQVARNHAFTNYVIPLHKGDTIYMFTDGYADQFGGDKGKKLMTAKFKEMLLSIQHLPMPQQATHLETAFDTWKGTHEQVDDVLVIGVRV